MHNLRLLYINTIGCLSLVFSTCQVLEYPYVDDCDLSGDASLTERLNVGTWTDFSGTGPDVTIPGTVLETDTEGQLWLMGEGLLQRLNGNSWIDYYDDITPANDGFSYAYRDLVSDAQKNIYVLQEKFTPLIAKTRILKFNGAAWDSVGPELFFTQILIDEEGRTFAGGTDLFQLNNNVWDTIPRDRIRFPFQEVQEMKVGKGNSIWLDINEGLLLRYNNGSWLEENYFDPNGREYFYNHTSNIAVDGNKNLWTILSIGLNRYTDEFWQYYIDSGFWPYSNPKIAVEGEGTIWIAYTREDGTFSLARYHCQRWDFFTAANAQIPADGTIADIEASDGKVWILMENGEGLFQFSY